MNSLVFGSSSPDDLRPARVELLFDDVAVFVFVVVFLVIDFIVVGVHNFVEQFLLFTVGF